MPQDYLKVAKALTIPANTTVNLSGSYLHGAYVAGNVNYLITINGQHNLFLSASSMSTEFEAPIPIEINSIRSSAILTILYS
jgi:hypothetical protein